MLLFWLFLLIPVALVYFLGRMHEDPSGHSYIFERQQLSTEDFYKSCERNISKRKIPKTEIYRVTHSEGGLGSPNRQYLHVARNEYHFDICAAPFGLGSFVSVWESKRVNFAKKVCRGENKCDNSNNKMLVIFSFQEVY
jgi:hypothetical protein